METNQKLDKILEQISDIRVTQAEQAIILEVNTKDLQEHMRRTDLLESEVNTIKASSLTKKDVYTALGIMGAVITFVLGVLEKLKLV